MTIKGFVACIHDPDTTLTFDLKVKFIGCMTWFCVQVTAFLSIDIVMFGTKVYHHGTMCGVYFLPLYGLALWTQYQHFVFTFYLSLTRSSLLFDIGIPKFGIWVYLTMRQHVMYILDLDLWPICGWRGVSLLESTHSFYLVSCMF